MNRSVLALVAILLLFCSAIPAGSAHAAALNTTTGVVGTQITVTGLTAGNTYTIKWDGTAIDTGTISSVNYVNFLIPEAYGGNHALVVESPIGTQVVSSTFTVIPSIGIEPAYGNVGSTIIVTGHGFAANETDITITVDSKEVQSGIKASSVGYWSTSFSAPAVAKGSHSIDASGATTSAASVANKEFNVNPSVKMEPASGGVGTVVTLTATGFTANESGVKVLYSSDEIKSGIAADAYGSWSTTFEIPDSTKGAHTINVYGSSTPQSDIADMVFTVAPSVVVKPNAGVIDDIVTVTGSGFYSDESNIYVTFDGQELEKGISADNSGTWTASIKIPASANGPHTIGAGGRLTAPSDVSKTTFTIQTLLSLMPKNGNVGDEVRVTGTGFSSSKDYNITFNKKAVATGATLDTGIFQTTFKVPAGNSGAIDVVAADSKGITASAVFNVETTAPDIPKINSPKDGATVGFMGETKVTFKWSAVSDPSGVSYEIEVSDDTSFGKKLVSRSNLTTTSYTTSEAESLNNGEYYWRVKAIDGAGNASDWSPVSTIKIGFITMNTVIWIAGGIIALVLIIIIVRQFSRSKKKKHQKSDWD